MEVERTSCLLISLHVVQTLRIHSEITLLHFFGRSGIVPICAADSTRVVWTRSLPATKIVSKRHVYGKCEHGLTYSILMTILFQFQLLFPGRMKLNAMHIH